MLCLSLVLELHHPLPAPSMEAGDDWSAAAAESYWPALRAISNHLEQQGRTSLTLVTSPSWMALATDPFARSRSLAEIRRQAYENLADPGLRSFVEARWGGDLLRLLRHLNGSGAVEVVPSTSSHTWLPSVAQDPVVARAQIRLAAADQTLRLGGPPSGIWLPFLGYLPGLETTMAQSRLRYFLVGADAFLRGSSLPPNEVFEPMITPPGVAAFGVSSVPTNQVVNRETCYGRDPRYHDPVQAQRAAAEHADHFVRQWIF